MTADPLASQKQQIKSGCQTVGGCLTVIIVCVLIVEAAPILLRRLTAIPAGSDAIVFARPGHLGNQMIYVPIIAVCVMGAGVAFAKSMKRSLAAIVLIFAAFCAIGYWLWYRPFTAIEFRGQQIRLHYLWPRPAKTIDTDDVVSIGEILSQEPSVTGSDFVYLLQLQTTSTRFVSMAHGSRSNITTAKTRIRRLNPGIGILDAPLW